MRTQRNLIAPGLIAAGAVIWWLATSSGGPGHLRAQDPHQKSPTGGSPVLPVPDAPFGGVIGRKAKESKPDFPKDVTAPEALRTCCSS